ncbi:hypothetical protein HDK77DRAFT_485646 [Phyllosticta capitalensis]
MELPENEHSWQGHNNDSRGFIHPEQQTQSLWSRRLSNFGLEVEKFPPIDWSDPDDDDISLPDYSQLALQMLYVASPRFLSTLEQSDGTFEAQSAIDKRENLFEGFFFGAWMDVAKGTLFCGKFGTFLSNIQDDCHLLKVQHEDKARVWRLYINEEYVSWRHLFNVYMDPEDIDVTGDAQFTSAQTFVKPNGLPAYLSVDFGLEHSLAVKGPPGETWFPTGIFTIKFRCEDGSMRKTSVSWVGGVYSFDKDNKELTRVIFDWGRGTVGISETGHWSTDPPTRRSRKEVELEMQDCGYTPSFMLFRHV